MLRESDQFGFRKYWFFSRKISCELLNFPAESFFKWTRQLWTFPGKLVQIAPTWCMTTTLMPMRMMMRRKVFSTLGLCCELRRGKIVGVGFCVRTAQPSYIYTYALYNNCGVRRVTKIEQSYLQLQHRPRILDQKSGITRYIGPVKAYQTTVMILIILMVILITIRYMDATFLSVLPKLHFLWRTHLPQHQYYLPSFDKFWTWFQCSIKLF